jgi:5-methyltetrahydrofolate--homocysteine methyltransferase
MTETIISSASKEIRIGFDHPFVIIGERINPTGRKMLAKEMAEGDFSLVEKDTLAQVKAGAQMLDINAGIPLADEPGILAETIKLVQSLTDVPLSIDSSIVEALKAGLEVYQGKALLNSVTGEEERLESVLPLVKKYKCSVVAISNDETGISEDPDVRYEVAKKIVERAQDHGIPKADVVVDPLVMPIGLPNRDGINAAFLTMTMASGLTSAITNPLHGSIMQAVMGGNVMLGHDSNCSQWINKYRGPASDDKSGSGRRERRRARTSRAA